MDGWTNVTLSERAVFPHRQHSLNSAALQLQQRAGAGGNSRSSFRHWRLFYGGGSVVGVVVGSCREMGR